MILYDNRKIVVFGIGHNADIISHYLDNRVAAFTVDGNYVAEDTFKKLPVVPYEELKLNFSPEKYGMFVAIGYDKLNHTRETVYNRVKAAGYNLVSYIDNCACTCRYSSSKFSNYVGDNTFIMELNNLQYKAKIGNNVIIWAGNHIGHGSIIRDHVYISSHVVISGFCDIGEYTFMGVNSATADGVSVGKNNLVGAGVFIGRSTEDNQVFASPKPRVLSFDDLSLTAQKMWRP